MDADMYEPEDILVNNILTRLPLKTLMRFKCASKQWNNLLSQPNYFLDTRSYPMFLLSTQRFHAIRKTSLPSRNKNIDRRTIKRPRFDVEVEEDDEEIVGAFKGIVVLVIKDKLQSDMIILYNPFTGVFERVPDPPLMPFDQGSVYMYSYGFCYGTTLLDDGDFDLKIVRIGPLIDTCYRWWDVFSFKNWSWSQPSTELIGCYRYFDVGTFVNGFLYWSSYRNPIGSLIMVLDVKKMRFSTIHLPPKCLSQVVTLGILNGQLGMICCKDYGVECELWVMKEHGSWSNIWSSSMTTTIISRGDYPYGFKPVSLLDEGKVVVLKRANQVIIYDVINGSIREVNNVLEEINKSEDFGQTM